MARIGIFGGTFNPPHKGHLLAAREARDALGLDRVLFIPDAQPPHKELPEGSPTASQRLELVRAAVAEVPFADVEALELERPGKSYTADTLAALRQRYPDDTLYLLTGTDMFLSLHQWYQPEQICRDAVIVGLRRKDSDPAAFAAQKERLEREFGAEVLVLDNQFVEISSTKVRRLLILGGAEKYVPQPVLERITAEGLYGTGRDYRALPMDELRQVATALLKKKRVAHVLGVAETARKLAERYGEDPVAAERAGLLHDVTKAIDGEDQLLLVEKYDIVISDFERSYPKVLHAKTGAAVARHVFGESEQVCQAIFWHTTGRPDMTLLEKIIYLADYIEPTRDFDGVELLRETVYSDLDLTLLRAFDMVLAELIRENKRLCEETPAARAFLAQRLGVPG